MPTGKPTNLREMERRHGRQLVWVAAGVLVLGGGALVAFIYGWGRLLGALQGAAIVLATLSPVLGRHVGPVARRLLSDLARAAKGGEAFGIKIHPHIRDIPGTVDYVISCIQAPLVPQLIKDCAAKGVKAICSFTSGFSEFGTQEGRDLEREVKRLAEDTGVRVIGPNCIGIHSPKACFSPAPDFPKESGRVAFLSQSGGNIGIGFAIPINMAKDLLPQLKKGKVVRGWLGVMIQKITPELKQKLDLKDEKGALVADVTPGGPAEKAGIQRGDVIVTFNGKEIKEMNELPYVVASTPVGKAVTVEVLRKGQKKNFEIKIAELKDEKEAPVVTEAKPKLGMTVEDLTPELAKNFGLSEAKGVVVVQVEDGSSSAEAGLRAGDVILEIDQSPVKDVKDFGRKIESYKAGDTVLILAKRRGATVFLTLKVRE